MPFKARSINCSRRVSPAITFHARRFFILANGNKLLPILFAPNINFKRRNVCPIRTSARVPSHTHGRYLCLIVSEHALVQSRTASFVPIGAPRYNCERFRRRVSTKLLFTTDSRVSRPSQAYVKNRGNESVTVAGAACRYGSSRCVASHRYSRVFGNNTSDVDAFGYVTTKRRRISC